MVKFNLEGLDQLEGLNNGVLGGFLASFGVLAVFFLILFAIAIVFMWVFGSIGLMNLAKKHKISNPWLAFIPVGRSYIIGKLGHEIYNSDNKNATTFMWITLGLGAASFLLGDSSGDLTKLVVYALLFFECYAFYNMFKNLKPNSAIVYTVFTALSDTLLGGIFIYLLKPEEKKMQEANVVEEKEIDEKVELDEEHIESKKTNTKKTKEKEINNSKYCSQCGAKLTSDARFCPECGNKVN